AVEAFAGPARWDPPRFTWEHRLDWVGSYPDDVGRLAWDGTDLIESGTFAVDGRDEPYSERWVRTGGPAPRLVAVATGKRSVVAVRVGGHAIVVAASAGGAFAVRRDAIVDGAVISRFGRAADMTPLPAFPFEAAWSVGERVDYSKATLEV